MSCLLRRFSATKDKSIDIVIELIGGETIAKEFVISAIREKNGSYCEQGSARKIRETNFW